MLLALFASGCSRGGAGVHELVVYTSLDRPHSAPIFAAFEKETGIRVRPVFDTEASKTVGLFHRLIAEKSHPKADVFWNSEVVRTVLLKREGLLAPYRSQSAEDIPVAFRDPDGFWTGFAARARVLLVHKEKVGAEAPGSVAALASPRWRGDAGMANPLFGTTNTHMAALVANEGEALVAGFFQTLVANNVQILVGNATVRDAVAAGELAICLTDTDDAYAAVKNGRPVEMLLPDQGEGQPGTLLIPNTVALIAGGPSPENGRAFIDFLLSPEVESMLAYSDSAQIPVRPGVERPGHVPSISELKTMEVDYEAAADAVEAVARLSKEHLAE